jgi:hypothetical protein
LAQTTFKKHSPHFPIVLQGSGANAPFTPVGGLDNTWVQGRRASRLFLNDNLAWSHGAHELRFGTNTRIFRLNDYDFGEGSVPTVTYTTLPQYIYGVASTATKTFPACRQRAFQLSKPRPLRARHLETNSESHLDFRRPRHAEFQSTQSSPRDCPSRGSFASISHDVNQPLNAAIQTGLGNVFSSTPLEILQPRMAIAWQLEPKTVLRTGFGIFSDILPGSVADLVGVNPPYVQTFQGGLLGTVGGTAIAPGVPNSAVDATVAANQKFSSGFATGQLSCALRSQSLQPVFLPSRSLPSQMANSTHRISWNGASDWNINSAQPRVCKRNTSAPAP